MSRQREITPAMRADIDRQLARFTPADMEPAVRVWREIRRERAAANAPSPQRKPGGSCIDAPSSGDQLITTRHPIDRNDAVGFMKDIEASGAAMVARSAADDTKMLVVVQLMAMGWPTLDKQGASRWIDDWLKKNGLGGR